MCLGATGFTSWKAIHYGMNTEQTHIMKRSISIKVKVGPTYNPYIGECLLVRTLVLCHRLCKVEWPVLFLPAFISLVYQPDNSPLDRQVLIGLKIKLGPIYHPYVGECLLEGTIVLYHWLCRVEGPVPFLTSLISTLFPLGPHLLLGGQ